jgi:hypothetical protein
MKIVESRAVSEHTKVRRGQEIDAQTAETCERLFAADTPPVLYLQIVFYSADDQSGALVESKASAEFLTGRKLGLARPPVVKLVQRHGDRIVDEVGSSTITVVEHGYRVG